LVPVVVLDANVLYPARLRDLFIRLSIAGLIRARWSERILDECFSNLIADRPDLTSSQLARTRRLMSIALPDAMIQTEAQHIEEALDLPDPDDRHVVETAIAADAEFIVTANLKDFPTTALGPFELVAIGPDALLVDLLQRDHQAVVDVITRQAGDLRHPPMSIDKLLDGLAEVGLKVSTSRLRITR
jgi:predicted nucleic acid-binding protein